MVKSCNLRKISHIRYFFLDTSLNPGYNYTVYNVTALSVNGGRLNVQSCILLWLRRKKRLRRVRRRKNFFKKVIISALPDHIYTCPIIYITKGLYNEAVYARALP